MCKMSSSACVYEIQAGRLAIQRAANPALRTFARTMVKEHSRLLLQLEQAARNSGAMTTAGTMLPQHLALLARLQSSGQDFDEVYRNIDVMTHLQALNCHRTYLVTGQNADLRNNALIALPLTSKSSQSSAVDHAPTSLSANSSNDEKGSGELHSKSGNRAELTLRPTRVAEIELLLDGTASVESHAVSSALLRLLNPVGQVRYHGFPTAGSIHYAVGNP